jgi:hypothetical protein
MISDLLPDLVSGGACVDIWVLIESLQGETFPFHEVLMVNFVLTQLRLQPVMSIILL